MLNSYFLCNRYKSKTCKDFQFEKNSHSVFLNVAENLKKKNNKKAVFLVHSGPLKLNYGGIFVHSATCPQPSYSALGSRSYFTNFVIPYFL